MRNGTGVDTVGPMELDVRNACKPTFTNRETAEENLVSLVIISWVVVLGAAQSRIALRMEKFEIRKLLIIV